VQVEHGLACGGAYVDADVVAVGGVGLFYHGAGCVDRGQQFCLLFPGGVKPGGHVALGDEECMAGRYGVRVPDAVYERAVVEALFGCNGAERAGVCMHESLHDG